MLPRRLQHSPDVLKVVLLFLLCRNRISIQFHGFPRSQFGRGNGTGEFGVVRELLGGRFAVVWGLYDWRMAELCRLAVVVLLRCFSPNEIKAETCHG